MAAVSLPTGRDEPTTTFPGAYSQVGSRLRVGIRPVSPTYIIGLCLFYTRFHAVSFGSRPKTGRFQTHATPSTDSKGTPVFWLIAFARSGFGARA
jgi:hypothetical protein